MNINTNTLYSLDIDLVVFVYKRLFTEYGYTSCALAAKELERMGYVSPTTGRPFSRQALHYHLKQSQDGRDLLMITKRRIGKA